jgi:N-acetylneuraminic acid mutarotase
MALGNLQTRFPALSRSVLTEGMELAVLDSGFAASSPAPRTLHATFPREGSGVLRMRGYGGVDLRVREMGMLGTGWLEQRAVVYARRGGAALWLSTRMGAEEWLYFEPGQAGEVLAAWEVENASVRQRWGGVEIVDHAGVVRMSVIAPRAYAMDGSEIAVAVTGSGTRIELRVEPTAQALMIDPLWLATGLMNEPRHGATAILLDNGKVLVAGGSRQTRLNSRGETDLAIPTTGELYDPATNAWSQTPPMVHPRFNHTATRLRDGRVLFAGGMAVLLGPTNMALSDAEVYDPSANVFQPVAAMHEARRAHAASLLADGKVLVVGGTSSNVELASAEIYDPVANNWSTTAPLSQARTSHTASLLMNGKVLVAGGGSLSVAIRSAELYDPQTNTWTPAGEYAYIRQYATATVLDDGAVLLAGGFDNTPDRGNLDSATRYDPGANAWSKPEAMIARRYEHTATLLSNGEVLVTGGYDYQGDGSSQAAAERYDPSTKSWVSTVAMEQARSNAAAAFLANGEVLIAGGFDGNSSLATAERYSLSSLELGAPCTRDGNCSSELCVDHVCCDKACNAGDCDACSPALGAEADGRCTLLSNTPCGVGRICWKPGTCEVGSCVGASFSPDGTSCGSGSCASGMCVPNSPDDINGSDAGAGHAASSNSGQGALDAGTIAARRREIVDAAQTMDSGESDPSGSRDDRDADSLPAEAGTLAVERDPSAKSRMIDRLSGRHCGCRVLGADRSAHSHLALVFGLLLLGWLRRRG